MVIRIPCPDSWQKIPLADLAWTFTRVNLTCGPVRIDRANDGLTLVLTFLQEKP